VVVSPLGSRCRHGSPHQLAVLCVLCASVVQIAVFCVASGANCSYGGRLPQQELIRL